MNYTFLKVLYGIKNTHLVPSSIRCPIPREHLGNLGAEPENGDVKMDQTNLDSQFLFFSRAVGAGIKPFQRLSRRLYSCFSASVTAGPEATFGEFWLEN